MKKNKVKSGLRSDFKALEENLKVRRKKKKTKKK
jgi:hypothetical protein